ncbi:polyadenylate-binding protein-interacting protein 1-like isoform X2 [Symsagittifera roscoffensis]|uniref:polyadenylate-binding protein-interacting protein 1-like isoform X2 n=1 Tax=Symsagittifera roscoffensis TaxID=84072 RepID=UPI00307C1A1D
MNQSKRIASGLGRGGGHQDHSSDLGNGFSNMSISNGNAHFSNGHSHLSQHPQPQMQQQTSLSSANQHLSEFQMLMDNNRPAVLQPVSTGNVHHDSLINEFKNLVLELSKNPTAFDERVPFLIESLNFTNTVPTEVIKEIVATLVKWAIESESFRYTGSKLANYLALPGQLTFDFLKVFLDSVTTECYDRLDDLISCTTANDYQVLEGIMLFMSELYLNMGIVTLDSTGQHVQSISRIEFLKDTLKRAILKILEKADSDKPLNTVGKVLKLTGAALEEQKQTKPDKELTDLIFVHVDAISKQDYCHSNVKSLFQRVLLLRQNHWQSPESNTGTGTNFANVSSSENFNDYDVPIFFLSDGTAIPAHEADFVENDLRASDRFMYLHGEGDVADSQTSNNQHNNPLAQLMSHTLSAEEEEAFNMFLSQMS